MGRKKVDELRALSVEELKKKLAELRKSLVEVRSSEQPGKARSIRRAIARVLTVLREKAKTPSEKS